MLSLRPRKPLSIVFKLRHFFQGLSSYSTGIIYIPAQMFKLQTSIPSVMQGWSACLHTRRPNGTRSRD